MQLFLSTATGSSKGELIRVTGACQSERMRPLTAIFVVGALAFTACSGNDDNGSSSISTPATSQATGATGSGGTEPAAPNNAPVDSAPVDSAPVDSDPPAATPADGPTLAAITQAIDGAPTGCDPLDTRQCMLPYPSNAYRIDGRVALPAEGMPVNAADVPIDPAEWNRNDGFSPNTPILTYISGLDAVASNLPSWTDLQSSLNDDASVVLVDAATGQRVPLWAELDSQATDDADRLLEIRPAVSLTEGATYVVGLRGLVDTAGSEVEPNAAFRAYRDNMLTDDEGFEARREQMEASFQVLGAAGIARSDLQLAWDFTVATTQGISGRMLHIRDVALAQLGDAAPAWTITDVVPNVDDNIAYQVEGTFEVPNFLTEDGGPGNRFFYGDGVTPVGDEMPVQNGTLQATFACSVSNATINGDQPAHLVQYGHGLLGDHHEILAGNVRAFANEHNVVFCATRWAGMSQDDIGNVVATIGDFSNFPTLADRLQQGVLNQIFLGRLMIAADGLVTDPNFQRSDGQPLIDTSQLNYDGNSQGGIMGQMLASVSPDIHRAVLGVTGMNYSLLLERSVDFDALRAIFQPSYPNDLDRVLVVATAQMLWDRGEGGGYVHHLVDDPYPGASAKAVLLHSAFGDWQVSELTAMIAARTMGVPIHRPVTADGRSREVKAGWGLQTITYPSSGSGLVIWDSGSDPMPVQNHPPRTGRDPHEDPRADADVRNQKAAFLFDDQLIDVCDAAACTADAAG